jgi:predicted RNA binding protein YcfA (HicA-like mRNA interferase family)
MSARLPAISGREAARAFERIGFQVQPDRGKGSHIVMARENHHAILTIPDHRELKRGTLRALIRNAALSVEEFVSLL